MRKILIHVVACLIALPFAMAWSVGFDVALLVLRPPGALGMWVASLAPLLRLACAALGLPFIVIWLANPVALKMKRFPRSARLLPFDPSRHSLMNEGLRYLEDSVALLRGEEFELLASYIDERDDLRVHCRLLEHRTEKTLAVVVWSRQFASVSLRSHTVSCTRTSVSSRGLGGDLPEPPGHVREYFAGLDARSLHAVHRALVARDGGLAGDGYRAVSTVGADPLLWASTKDMPLLEWRTEQRILKKVARDGSYRLTWRWAARAGWQLLWPLRARVQRARMARGRKLLDELGFGLPLDDASHGSGAFTRAATGLPGALCAMFMVAFSLLALLALSPRFPYRGGMPQTHWHPAEATHACPCEVPGGSDPDVDESVVLFDASEKASRAAGALRRGGGTVVEFPDVLFVRGASEADVAAQAAGAALHPRDAHLGVAIACTARSPEDARALATALEDSFRTSSFGAVPPWVSAPSDEHARARHTLRYALAGLEPGPGADGVDAHVLKLYAERPRGGDTAATEAWLRGMRLAVGGEEGDHDRPGQSAGAASAKGSLVTVDGLSFPRARRGLREVAQYLCANGCTDVRFGYEGDAPRPGEH